ncbi:MAG: hypothetical protein WCG78_05410 [Candidatus Omnitrophota bacterium]
MRLLKSSISAVLFLGLVGAAVSGAGATGGGRQEKELVEVIAAVDNNSPLIGDTFTYVITVKVPRNIEVEFPNAVPGNLAGFAVKDFGSSQGGIFGARRFKQWYLLDTYTSGEQVIPATAVKYRVKGSAAWREMPVKEVKVNIRSMLNGVPQRQGSRDIRGPKCIVGRTPLVAALVAGSLLALGMFFGFLWMRKRAREYHAPLRSAHEIAYEALEALEKKDYIHRGQASAYYSELSGIVRRYLENRFAIRAPEMTTEEFLLSVKEEGALVPEHKGLLRDFLMNCDMVKFAKYQPGGEDAAVSFASAKRLVDQTRQAEVVNR